MPSIRTLLFHLTRPNAEFDSQQRLTGENYLRFSCLINTSIWNTRCCIFFLKSGHTLLMNACFSLGHPSPRVLPTSRTAFPGDEKGYVHAGKLSVITDCFNMCFNSI